MGAAGEGRDGGDGRGQAWPRARLRARKYPAPTRPLRAQNKNTIMTLSKQVRTLQMARYGFKQWQHQHIARTDGTATPGFNALQNYVNSFMVNNFFTGHNAAHSCTLYYGTMSGGVPTLGTHSRFSKVTSDLDVQDQFMFNYKQGADAVNQIRYLPAVSSTMKFNVHCNSGPNLPGERVRIQIFKFKNVTSSSKFQIALPYNSGAYWHMCDKNPAHRNHLNTHEYHTVIADKSVYFPQTDTLRDQVESVRLSTTYVKVWSV